MIIKDTVFESYQDNISAEAIAHTKHVTALTPEGLSKAAMIDVDPDYHKKLEHGKIMVAGYNFGCNSSREWAPAALLYSGVKLIIARSFSRIFFRNAINIGLPILECNNIKEIAFPGDRLEVNLSTGEIINTTKNITGQGTILPPFLLNIMSAGGLLETLDDELEG